LNEKVSYQSLTSSHLQKKKTNLLESKQPQYTAVDSDKIQNNQGLEEEDKEEEEDAGDWTPQWINKVHHEKLLRCSNQWERT
jgi:hypothetical protein